MAVILRAKTKKPPAPRCGRLSQQFRQEPVSGPGEMPKRLTLRELLPAACLVETDLLTFHFTRVAGDEACVRQLRLQRCVVVHQRAGDAVAHRAGLPRLT